MKKTALLATVILVPALMTGCSTMSKEVHPDGVARLSAQSNQIVSRPIEYSMKTLAEASGEASVTKVLGFTVDGDSVKSQIPILGGIKADPLVEVAAFRAVASKNGDAFYALRAQTESSGFWPFYSKRHVKVTGKVLTVKEIGMMSADRADKRTVAAAAGKKGFFARILGK